MSKRANAAMLSLQPAHHAHSLRQVLAGLYDDEAASIVCLALARCRFTTRATFRSCARSLQGAGSGGWVATSSHSIGSWFGAAKGEPTSTSCPLSKLISTPLFCLGVYFPERSLNSAHEIVHKQNNYYSNPDYLC